MHDDERKPPFFHISGCRLEAERPQPGLHLVATPIGNLEDMTIRALRTLAGADTVLCEDTRHTGRLLERYGIRARLLPYHDHNAERMRPRVLKLLDEGKAVALATDAGMPVVSDPGMKLARAAAEAGHSVHVVPGPSAALAALAVSGLASDRFLFAGFPPAKAAARRRWLAELAEVPATLILFESPHRIAAALADMAEVLGPRSAALCRELTKLHEEVIRLPLDRLATEIAGRGGVKGEITLVIAPPEPREAAESDIEEALRQALAEMLASRAAATVAKRFGIPRKRAWDMAMRLANEK